MLGYSSSVIFKGISVSVQNSHAGLYTLKKKADLLSIQSFKFCRFVFIPLGYSTHQRQIFFPNQTNKTGKVSLHSFRTD